LIVFTQDTYNLGTAFLNWSVSYLANMTDLDDPRQGQNAHGHDKHKIRDVTHFKSYVKKNADIACVVPLTNSALKIYKINQTLHNEHLAEHQSIHIHAYGTHQLMSLISQRHMNGYDELAILENELSQHAKKEVSLQYLSYSQILAVCEQFIDLEYYMSANVLKTDPKCLPIIFKDFINSGYKIICKVMDHIHLPIDLDRIEHWQYIHDEWSWPIAKQLEFLEEMDLDKNSTLMERITHDLWQR